MAASTPQYTSVDFEQKFNLSTKKLILRPILEWAPTFDETDFEGINFKCVAPSTLVFHENDQFLTDADIPTPLPDMLNTVTFEVDLPEFDSLIEMGGVYTITMTLHDGNGDAAVVEKKFTLAMPEQCSCDLPASNDGCAVLSTKIDCEKAKLIVVDRTAYLYNGVQSVDIIYEITTYSPPELLLAPIVSTIPYFSIIDIYSGTYKVVLSNTASYDFPDNTIVVVGYNTYSELAASCSLDLCEANCAFDSLYDSWVSTKASFPSKAIAIENKLQKASFIFLKIRNKQECGESVSDDVVELNKLLGTNCDCNCPTHLTVSPSSLCCDVDLTIRGAADDITVTPTIVGNTFDFLIANKKIYLVTRDASNAGVLTITSIFTATQKEFKITLSYAALITALEAAGLFTTIDADIAAIEVDVAALEVAVAALVAADGVLMARTRDVLFNNVTDVTAAGTGSYSNCKTYTLLHETLDDGDMLIIEAEYYTDDVSDNNVGKSARIQAFGGSLSYLFAFASAGVEVVKIRIKITRVSNTEINYSSETELYTAGFFTEVFAAKAGVTNTSISGLNLDGVDYDINAQGQNINAGAQAVVNKSLQIRIARI